MASSLQSLLWLQRWYYMRRLVLGGLNVFMLDTDVVFFHDPYPFFKAQFANHSLFCLSDSSVHAAKANGGVWYLQNVHPRGPIASQLLAAFEGRTLRLIRPPWPGADLAGRCSGAMARGAPCASRAGGSC